MKKITTVTSIILVLALTAAFCLAGCGGSSASTTAAETTAAGESAAQETTATQDTAAETAAAVSTKTYTISDEEVGATLTLEIPELDGIEVDELSTNQGYNITYDEGGWMLELFINSANAEALASAIEKESVTYGDNTASLEFSSWAAHGRFDFGEDPNNDALALVVELDLRPADTYQPDDEDELRGYLEDENVSAILSAMKLEAD